MEQGYEDTRFENTIDRHFQCPICLNILKDPVQCRQNQHYFCTPCITKHLQENSLTCPTCKDELTIDTLDRPAKILTDLLSTFKISCDHAERGCREMVELGALKRHVADCGFGPVVCSNGECMEEVNKREKEVHESKVCEFRMIKCEYCGEKMEFVKFKNHRCPTRKEIDEIKMDLSEVKEKMDKLCSAQEEMAKEVKSVITMMSVREEMAKEMRSMMSDIKESLTNTKQVPQSSCHVCRLPEDITEDIVIAGGQGKKSVEMFSWSNQTWELLGEMNQCRSAATSFVYEKHMVVTGGYSDGTGKDSVEKMDLTQKDGQWTESRVKLPSEVRGHKTVLDRNRLIVIGGWGNASSYSNVISEVLLTHPYSSKSLTKMPLPRFFHGVEHINEKIYILGGMTSNGITNTVLMYDPITNRCKKMTSLPFPVWIMATVSWKDNVIVLGGEDKDMKKLNTVIMYNVNTGKSRMLPEMNTRRRGCTAVMTGNKIVVMGGGDDNGIHLNSAECYNFETYTWEDLPVMNEARTNATSVVKPACL